MSQRTTGYAPVNGLRMYYEVHGTGRPLVLLHGGLMTIDLSFGDIWPELATDRQVIATELQGHGRTADIDRDIELRYLAGDVAALLDHLGIGQADVLGFSLGGGVALQLALDQPDRVGRVILASVSYASDGFHAEISDPAQHATSTRMPTAEDFGRCATPTLAWRLIPVTSTCSRPRHRRPRGASRAGPPRNSAESPRPSCSSSATMTSSAWNTRSRCTG